MERGVVVIGRDRAEERCLVHDACQTGHQLTDLDAWHVGSDRVEFAAYFGRRLRLEVERVEMGGATRQENHNDGFMRVPDPRFFLRPQQVGQSQAGQGERPDSQEIAAGHPIAESPGPWS
jgi:hypothetical protein